MPLKTQKDFTQKQPTEVFCKKRCSSKFDKIHRKTSARNSLIKLQALGLKRATLLTKSLAQVFSCSLQDTHTDIFCLNTTLKMLCISCFVFNAPLFSLASLYRVCKNCSRKRKLNRESMDSDTSMIFQD